MSGTSGVPKVRKRRKIRCVTARVKAYDESRTKQRLKHRLLIERRAEQSDAILRACLGWDER
jgi:hypothetical protein